MASGKTTALGSSRQFNLVKESKLKVEVNPDTPLHVHLLSGTIEIFGTELPPENWLSIMPHQKLAIFTSIKLDGVSKVEYVADEMPMVSYANVHAILDGRRIHTKHPKAPRVIVVGPMDSGEYSLCRMH